MQNFQYKGAARLPIHNQRKGSQFRAVVDWVEIQIQTVRSTNFMEVQKELREIFRLPDEAKPPYVKAQDSGGGGAATVFTFRIQDPERHHEILNVIQELSAVFGCVGRPRITAIEVAFDAYNTGAEQAAKFSKFSTSPIRLENCRIYREYKVDAVQQIPSNFDSLVRCLREGWQVSLGNDQAEYHQHIYYKVKDGGKPIPQSGHRARIEVTLRGAMLPVQTLEDLSHFKFGSLSEFFQFRKLKFPLTPFEQVVADASARIGANHPRNRREGGTRLHSKLTQSDTALNTSARSALRELARRWQAVPKRRRRPLMVGEK